MPVGASSEPVGIFLCFRLSDCCGSVSVGLLQLLKVTQKGSPCLRASSTVEPFEASHVSAMFWRSEN